MDNIETLSGSIETLEAALELAKRCPILAYGGSVEVREIPKPIELKK